MLCWSPKLGKFDEHEEFNGNEHDKDLERVDVERDQKSDSNKRHAGRLTQTLRLSDNYDG